MKIYSAKVISNKHVSHKYFHLVLSSSVLASIINSGQIVHVKCGDEFSNYILKRPFSIYRFDKEAGTVEFLYLVKGKGTEYMSRLKPGDELELLGPTGNYYEISGDTNSIAVIGRGVGIASIVSLAELARTKNLHVTAVLSARNAEAIVAKDFLIQIGCNVLAVNDEDGSSSVENVKALLNKSINENKISQIYTCGSKRMGRMVRELSEKYHMTSYISLEEHMACGIGVCKGCVCKTKDGYKTVCKDGPVFSINEVVL